MYVVVDFEAAPVEVTLADPDDCTRFHVSVCGSGDAPGVDDALRSTDTGWLDDEGEAFVRVARVQSLAAARVADDWPERFRSMLAFASGKGWLSDDGEVIRAHVEWQ